MSPESTHGMTMATRDMELQTLVQTVYGFHAITAKPTTELVSVTRFATTSCYDFANYKHKP